MTTKTTRTNSYETVLYFLNWQISDDFKGSLIGPINSQHISLLMMVSRHHQSCFDLNSVIIFILSITAHFRACSPPRANFHVFNTHSRSDLSYNSICASPEQRTVTNSEMSFFYTGCQCLVWPAILIIASREKRWFRSFSNGICAKVNLISSCRFLVPKLWPLQHL